MPLVIRDPYNPPLPPRDNEFEAYEDYRLDDCYPMRIRRVEVLTRLQRVVDQEPREVILVAEGPKKEPPSEGGMTIDDLRGMSIDDLRDVNNMFISI